MPTPLIPRSTLFGNPDRDNVQLSPDGRFIVWVAPLDGVINIWAAPREEPQAARPLTRDRERGIYIYFLAYDGKHVLYNKDSGGDENWHLMVTDMEGSEPRDLTPYPGVMTHFWGLSPRHPGEVLVGLNDRNPQFHDAWRIEIATGKRTLVLKNEGFSPFVVKNEGCAGFVFDLDFKPRLAMRMNADGSTDVLKVREDLSWEIWDSIPAEDSMTWRPIGLDSTGKKLYFYESRGRNTSALVERDMEGDQVTVLAEDEGADLQDVIVHPSTRVPQAASFIRERKEWNALDAAMTADMERISKAIDGELWIHSRSLDDRFWILVFDFDDGPVRFHLYDREAGRTRYLFSNSAELEKQSLVKMRSITIKARDGLDLVSYYSLPADSDSDGDGIPDEPLPLVLIPHGGPWHRDRWGCDPNHQWLANRGYAVLSVNFRASTGFGKAFTNAGDREWGGKIIEDQIDAVKWAIGKGIADPAKCAVLGGSFGGYSVLAGLSMHPELYVCGVDICGPANLVTLLETIPPYWKPMLEDMARRMGDPRTEEGRELLKSHSPLTYADKIRSPLLIGQGQNDPRVKRAEADQIVGALKAKGIPVTYVLYPDEGHGFARPENRLSFFAMAEEFLARSLGGRCEPIGDAFSGSSIQILEGPGKR